MHQGYRGEEYLGVLDRFARYGLPLHLTETTLVSGDLMPPDIVDLNDYQIAEWPSTPEGEARQADDDRAPLPDAGCAPGGAVDHVLGTHRRRGLARRPGRPGARRRHAASRRTTRWPA